MKTLLFIFGTRPEAIKLVPLIEYCRQHPEIDCKICITSQHKEMLHDVLDFFGIQPDYDLDVMTPNQNLYELTGDLIGALKPVVEEVQADYVVVQGDTTSAFVGALAGFYSKTPVVHIEAGLRSFDTYSPFPEEMNRQLISRIAEYHFVPTESAKQNLAKEGIDTNVYVVGNTVVDTLKLVCTKLDAFSQDKNPYRLALQQKGVSFEKDIVLVTLHRRENFGARMTTCCDAILALARQYSTFQFVVPVHSNPAVQSTLREHLSNVTNIRLLDPLSYPHFIYLMYACRIVMTDSGGVQEEAPSFGKPVLVVRDVTERVEGIEAGISILAGCRKADIVTGFDRLLSMTKPITHNPYGDGHSTDRIFERLFKRQLVGV